MKITRRKLFGLLAGAAVAPKELLAAPVAATGAITMEALQRAYAAAKFDIAYMQADTAMVFEPKFYYAFVSVKSAPDGLDGFFEQERQRREKEVADSIWSVSC